MDSYNIYPEMIRLLQNKGIQDTGSKIEWIVRIETTREDSMVEL